MSQTITVPTSWIQSVGGFHLPSQIDRHLQQLMDRNNEGLLDPAEKQGLAALACLSEEMALLRAQALQLLGQHPA